MFAIGFFLFCVFSLLAILAGDKAPDWLKLVVGFGIFVGLVLILASLSVIAWRVLP